MNNNNYEEKYEANDSSGYIAGLSLVTGLLLGGLAGAGAMLLMAPQSGKKTRAKIQRKGQQMRKQTTSAVDGAVAQVRSTAHQVSTSIHDQSEALQQRGQDVVDQQRERWSPVVEAGKTAVNNS
jgi:gas vesicle protein